MNFKLKSIGIITKIEKSFGNKLLNFLYPTDIKCIFCKNELHVKNRFCICEKCFSSLPFISESKKCYFCGTPIDSLSPVCDSCYEKKSKFLQARAPFEYYGIIKNIIKRLKYNNERYLARPLAEFMAIEYHKNNFACDCLLPIPLTNEKQQKRGYNQSELLANELSQILQLPKLTNIQKIKSTLTQTNLNQEERKINLQNAFKIYRKSEIKNKKVLLIDDVFTTGTTVEVVSNLLIKSGVKSVYVLTLAHTNFYRYKNK